MLYKEPALLLFIVGHHVKVVIFFVACGKEKRIIDGHSRFRILLLSAEQLQQSFEDELPDHSNQPTSYARNLVEYCAHKALRVETQRPDHLADKGFSLLTFDMMLAWEAPDMETEFLLDVRHLSIFTAAYLQNPLKFMTWLSGTIFYFDFSSTSHLATLSQ